MTEANRAAMTVTEAAQMLGISRALACQLVASGELPALRLGRRIIVPRRAIEAMLFEPTDHRSVISTHAPSGRITRRITAPSTGISTASGSPGSSA